MQQNGCKIKTILLALRVIFFSHLFPLKPLANVLLFNTIKFLQTLTNLRFKNEAFLDIDAI